MELRRLTGPPIPGAPWMQQSANGGQVAVAVDTTPRAPEARQISQLARDPSIAKDVDPRLLRAVDGVTERLNSLMRKKVLVKTAIGEWDLSIDQDEVTEAVVAALFDPDPYEVYSSLAAGSTPAFNRLTADHLPRTGVTAGQYPFMKAIVTQEGVIREAAAGGIGDALTGGTDTGKALKIDSSGNLAEMTVVTFVGLSMPSIFSVSQSPVTTTGTLTAELATQTAHTFLCGPASGLPDVPTFRALDVKDFANNLITVAKLAASATDVVFGRSSAGAGLGEEIACTAAGRALIDDADASAQRTTLGVAIGTNVQAYDATLTALAAYNTNGLLTQTAADTFTGRTLTGTSNVITVTNGDGVSGNPTVTISATYVGQTSITTLGTIATGTWNAGNVTISNTAPTLTMTDTTASAKSLTVVVDANLVDIRESAGSANSLVTLDLANSRVGFFGQPSYNVHVKKSQNTVTQIVVENPSNGSSALTSFAALNDAGRYIQFAVQGSGFGGSGLFTGEVAYWNSNVPGGMLICTMGAYPIVFGTNTSTEAMRITGVSVGIGTASPAFNAGTGLHVHAPASTQCTVRLTNTTTGSTSADGFEIANAGTAVYVVNFENDSIYFWANNDQKMELTAGGVLKNRAGTSSSYVTHGGALFDHNTDVGNTTTTETDLYSDTLPASLFGTNKDKVSAFYAGVFVSSGTATRQVRIYFAGTLIFDSGALTLSLSSAWVIYVEGMRVSSSVVRWNISMTTEGAALAAYTQYTEVTSLTLTNTNILKITGTAAGVGAATNDILAKMGAVQWLSAA